MLLHLRKNFNCVFSFIFLLYINPLSAEGNVCKQDNYYLIRNQHSGLALDATDPVVLIQQVTGKPAQLWSFEYGHKPGLFVIVNKETGNALDSLEVYPQKCITDTRDGSLRQEWWITSSGNIVNAATNMCLDVNEANFTEGNFLHMYKENRSAAQKFVLQKNRNITNIL